MSKEVRHDGIVKQIDGDTLFVSIINKSACVSCNLNGACNVSEMSEKIIEVNRAGLNFNIGEKVLVSLEEHSGLLALFLGYVLPFIFVLLTLIIGTMLFTNELWAGLISLIVLIPYYIFLYFSKDKIKKQFSFFVYKY